jgi:hypothetical protein
MTTSTYKILEPYKDRLGYAKKYGYGRFDRTELSIFFTAYKDTFNEELSRAAKACPHCVKRALTRLFEEMEKFESCPAGKKYLKEKRENAEKE